MYRHFAS
jgi:AcrR family transcriptional regulator